MENETFLLGFLCCEKYELFKDEILYEFIPSIEEQLKSEGFYSNNGNVYYSLLTGESVGI